MKRIYFFIILTTLLGACKKSTENGNVNASITFNADGKSLVFDTIAYNHPAGYLCGFNSVQLYLSDFIFYKSSGEIIHKDEVWYVDNSISNSLNKTFNNLPPGNYTAFQCYIGLDSLRNKSGSLGSEAINQNMEWPTPMGGGYHFLKLEGNYIDGGKNSGFAMHLGTNQCLIQTNKLDVNFTVPEGGNITLPLSINLMEWFKNPEIFDFNKDGNYIMGNAAAMKKFASNGKDILK